MRRGLALMRLACAFAMVYATLWLVPSRALGFCTFLGVTVPHYDGFSSVRVVIHEDLEDYMKHPDGLLWTRQELEQSVHRTLQRLNASAAADTPRLYLDTLDRPTCAWLDEDCNGVPNSGVTCPIPNTINIIPTHCGATAMNFFANESVVIWIQKAHAHPLVGDMRWTHTPNEGVMFEDALLHELGHALSLWHPAACSDPAFPTICPTGARPCSVMHADTDGTVASDYFMLDDTNGLRFLWGARTLPVESQFESSNLDTGYYSLSLGNVDLSGFYGASSRVFGSSEVTIVGYDRSSGHAPKVYSWNFATLGLTSLGLTVGPQRGNGPVGAAQTSTLHYVAMSGWRLSSDSRRWQRQIVRSNRLLSGGSGWSIAVSNPAAGTIADTVAGGMSTVFDDVSGVVLHAFRSTDGRVVLQDSLPGFGVPFDTSIRSVTTPLLACSDHVGTNNCILVTVDPGWPVTPSSTQRFQWVEFRWNASSDNWTAGSLNTESWLNYGDATLAVHRAPGGSNSEFVVGYQVPVWVSGLGWRNRVYVLRKLRGASSFTQWGSLQDFTSVAFVAGGSQGAYQQMFHFAHN